MDELRFPRLTEYLSHLPNGLLSYPEYECKASIYRGALAALPAEVDFDGIDPLLADYIDNPSPMSAWIPEVVNGALYLAFCDRAFHGAEARYLAWIESIAQAVFSAPAYRFLMMVASPKRLATNGERRWPAFHRGTEYEIEIHEGGTKATLTYPPHLFNHTIVSASVRAIVVAYRAAGATEADLEIVRVGRTQAQFKTIWYPGAATGAGAGG